jgi:hypothetical protein
MPGLDAPQENSPVTDEPSPLQAERRQVQMIVLTAPLGIGVTEFYIVPAHPVNAKRQARSAFFLRR